MDKVHICSLLDDELLIDSKTLKVKSVGDIKADNDPNDLFSNQDWFLPTTSNYTPTVKDIQEFFVDYILNHEELYFEDADEKLLPLLPEMSDEVQKAINYAFRNIITYFPSDVSVTVGKCSK